MMLEKNDLERETHCEDDLWRTAQRQEMSYGLGAGVWLV